jgi:hypothetical protein
MTVVRLLASALDRSALDRIAPPACAGVEPLPAWERLDERSLRITVALPAGALAGADRIIPSLSSTATGDHAFQAGLRIRTREGIETPWVRLSRIGRVPAAAGPLEAPDPGALPAERQAAALHEAPELPVAEGPIGTDVDTFLLRAPAERAEIGLRVWAQDPDAFRRAPCLLAISSAGPPGGADPPHDGSGDPPPIPVPSISQMSQAEQVRMRTCSPTSVAMVLGALGLPADAPEVAALAYSAEHDRYGVWPANVWAASRWGAIGYVAVMRSWECVRTLLANGLPLVLSESHGPGELPGSPLPETSGHLLALRGLHGPLALVNDPAAPTDGTVAREYRIEDLDRAWLKRSAVAYVFVRPEGRA